MTEYWPASLTCSSEIRRPSLRRGDGQEPGVDIAVNLTRQFGRLHRQQLAAASLFWHLRVARKPLGVKHGNVSEFLSGGGVFLVIQKFDARLQHIVFEDVASRASDAADVRLAVIVADIEDVQIIVERLLSLQLALLLRERSP